MWELDCKRSWVLKNWCFWSIDAFEVWRWRRLLRVPWTTRRSNLSILKEISSGCSLEGLMLKLKLQYFGYLMWRADSLEKTLRWERLKISQIWWKTLQIQEVEQIPNMGEKGMTEDEKVGWHHRLNGHEFEQALGVGDGQGSLACWSPWGLKESDTTEWLIYWSFIHTCVCVNFSVLFDSLLSHGL